MSEALVAACEAVLFVADEPLDLHELALAVEADADAVEAALDALERRLAERGAGVVVDRTGARYGLRAAPGEPASAASRLQARAPERGASPALEGEAEKPQSGGIGARNSSDPLGS